MKTVFSLVLFGLSLTAEAQGLQQAIDDINHKEVTKAKQSLLQQSNAQPLNAEVSFWLGVALCKEYTDKSLNPNSEPKLLIDAGISFEKAFYLDPNCGSKDGMTHLNMFNSVVHNAGIQSYQESEMELAFTFFKMASESSAWLGKSDSESNYYAGHCANLIGEPNSAKTYLEKVVYEHPDHESAPKELLKAYKKMKLYDKASSVINQSLARDQSDKYFWYEKMSLCMKTDQLDEALKAAKQLSALDGSNARNFSLMASLYDQTGNELKAIESYEQAIKLNPKDVQSNFNLGVMYYNQAVNLGNMAASKANAEKSKKLLAQAEKHVLAAKALDSSNADIPSVLNSINALK